MTINYRCDCPEGGRCYVKQHMPDWAILKGCFPPGVRPTDVDGAIELNGYVLFMEWKGIESPLTTGQARMFMTMTRDAPKQRVLVLFGDKGVPKRAALFHRGKRLNRDCDIDWLRQYCTAFTAMATKQRKVA